MSSDHIHQSTPGAMTVFALAWPMTLKAIFLHGTVVIDGLLVSPLGETALAAMGLAAAVGGMILGAIFAFSHAMQIRTAQSFGTGDLVGRKSVLASGLTVGASIGLAGICIIAIFGKAILSALSPNDVIAAQAWSYLAIFAFVILGESLGQTIASHFNGCGRTKIPLIGYCLSVPMNVTASYALIHGIWGLPAFGVAGAAMGSAIAICVQALFLLIQLRRTDRDLLKVAGWQRGAFAPTLKRHVIFSLPIAATFISANFASHVCVLLYANMALPAFAALTLIAPWNMVAGQISMQWTQATGILVAQMLGRNTPEPTLDRFVSRAWRGAFLAAAIVALVFLGMCLSLDVLYPSLLPETRAILFGFLPLMMIIQFPRATNAICGNTLRASGDTVYVMHLFIWSQWAFRVPMIALGVLYFELSAFWILSMFLWEEVIKFLPFHRRMAQGRWKRANVSQ